MTLVRNNSTLISVVDGDDVTQWEGSLEANAVEEVIDEITGADLDRSRIAPWGMRTKRRYLDVPAGRITVEVGYVVTWTRDGETFSADVRELETDHAILGFIRLDLEPEVELPETGRVLTRTTASSGGGGTRESWDSGPDLLCRIDPIGGGKGSASPGDRIDDRTTQMIALPAGTQITEADRVEIDGKGVFEVTQVRRRSEELVQLVEAIEA